MRNIFIKYLLCFVALLYMGISYAGSASIEPEGDAFPAQMQIGISKTVTYKIENSTGMPLSKVDYPNGINKVSDDCHYFPDKTISTECRVGLSFTAQSTTQHIQGTPSVSIGPYNFPSAKGPIDIQVVPGTPANLAWGSIPTWEDMMVGDPSVIETYTIENSGQTTAVISSVGLKANAGPSVTIIGGSCQANTNLKKAETCTVKVQSNPSEVGSVNEDLEISYSDKQTNDSTLSKKLASPIKFVVNAKGSLEWQIVPTWNDMNTKGPAVTETYQIENANSHSVSISSIGFEPGGDNRLTIEPGGTCSTANSLAPNETCTIKVKADPKNAGNVSQLLRVEHDGAGSPLLGSIHFDVTDLPGNLVWDAVPTWKDMWAGDVDPQTNTYTLKNSGGSPVTLGAINLSPGGDSYIDITGGGTCHNGKVLQPEVSGNNADDSCTIVVEANVSKATSTQSISQNLVVANNGLDPQIHSHINFAINTKGVLVWQDLPEWHDMIMGVTPLQSHTYTLLNNGGVTTNITKIDGPTNSNLSMPVDKNECAGKSLAPNESCDFVVEAQANSVDDVADVIKIYHDGEGGELDTSVNFTIHAQGNLIWHKQETPNWSDLVEGGDPITQTYVVENNGGSAATISSIAIEDSPTPPPMGKTNSGDILKIDDGGTCTLGHALGVGKTCSILVTAAPSSQGDVNKDLVVKREGSDSKLKHTITFSVNAPGVLEWSGTNPSWGDMYVDETNQGTYTAKNSGSADVKIGSIGLDPGDSRLFIGGGGTCHSGNVLKPNEECTIEVLASPNYVNGPVNQDLIVSHSGGQSPLKSEIVFGTKNVRCWGDNTSGQLNSPVGTFTQVTAGDKYTCAVKEDGSIQCWGLNNDGQATPPDGTYKQLNAGDRHICAVSSVDGSIKCWGYNDKNRATPPSGAFTQVSAGGAHTCAIKESDGSIQCWGANIDGQASPYPGIFIQVSAGDNHSCGIQFDGSIKCWGNNGKGQVSNLPTGLFKQLSAGHLFNCAIKESDGSVNCWGDGGSGQTVSPSGAFSQISAGGEHACAVNEDGSVRCWGNGDDEQIFPPTNGNFAQVSAGMNHTCAILGKVSEVNLKTLPKSD